MSKQSYSKTFSLPINEVIVSYVSVVIEWNGLGVFHYTLTLNLHEEFNASEISKNTGLSLVRRNGNYRDALEVRGTAKHSISEVIDREVREAVTKVEETVKLEELFSYVDNRLKLLQNVYEKKANPL